MKQVNPPKKQPPKRLEISPEDLEKVRLRRQKADSQKIKVSPEWRMIAEFGYYFGWEAVKDVRDKTSGLTGEEMRVLLEGAKRVWAEKEYEMAQVMFIATASANSKKPVAKFRELTKDIIKRSKADL